jgi:cytochrome c oxidase subunit 2
MNFTPILSFIFLTLLALSFTSFNIAYLDSPEDWQTGFQDPASPIMQGIIELHHDLFFFLIVVLAFVF